MTDMKKTDGLSQNNPMDEFKRARLLSRQGGGEKRIKSQHEKGKMTARERIDTLLDKGSFQELGSLATHQVTDFGMAEKRFPGDGVVTGIGKINGRRVAVYARTSRYSVARLARCRLRRSIESRISPWKVASLSWGSTTPGGARVQEGVRSLAAYGEVFARNVKASGVIPQISVIMGPCAGGAVYSPALTDFTVMVDGTSAMFLTGPGVVASVTGEKVSAQELGGSDVHSARSGNAHFRAHCDAEALALVQLILGYLPSNTQEDAPVIASNDPVDRRDDALNDVVPSDEGSAYSMREVLETIFDRGSLLEVHREFAPNAIVAFARLGGRSVGVVSNEPSFMSGVLDINSSDKISRFVRFCDTFSLPVITFVDCPGYLPGVDQEYNGVIRHGAKIIYAYCESTVPKISVVTRKAIGGSYVALGSRQMGTDVTLAWPTAQIAVMGPEGAAPLINGRQICEASNPDMERQRFIQEYRQRFFNPYRAADIGQIDEVIEPRETRFQLAQALDLLQTKVVNVVPKKHGLFPV